MPRRKPLSTSIQIQPSTGISATSTHQADLSRSCQRLADTAIAVNPDDERYAPLIKAINELKRERNAVVLAHNYQTPEIYHGVADFVGDSLALAQQAAKTPADLLAFVRRASDTIFHGAGTCRMGPRDNPDSVVDASLRVKGVDGLRVADASIMPEVVSATTHAACVMIGEKAADLLLSEQGDRG